MSRINLESMSIDELWTLHEEVAGMLKKRIIDQKSVLEKRLRDLTRIGQHARRPYPRVLPKYRNTDRPSETWSGRGKQPRWLTAQLRSGKRIEHFLIAHRQRDKGDRSAPVR
jgi:DNA-binding protein H-NS